MMQYIGLGAAANDGTGDKLRIAGDKINDNFLEISGKALTGSFQIIQSLTDLPTPVAGVITLAADTTYYFINKLDMLTNRFILSQGTVLRGASSVNCGIENGSTPLISSNYQLDINNFSVTNSTYVFLVDSNPLTDNAYISNVTFTGCDYLGSFKDLSSVIFTSCSFIDSGDLEFGGTIGTLAIDNCLGIPQDSTRMIHVLSTCTITKRFRVTYSSFVVNLAATGIDVNASAIIPDESYILDTCNFSGTSSFYLGGLDQTSNKALFSNCKGINNTSVIGQAYMQGNAAATVIAAPSTFVKVAGTTISGSNNSKYLHSNNRLTCDAAIERKFLVICQLSFTSGNNQACEFGFYDSTIPGIRPASRTVTTTSGAGVSENVSFTSVISHNQSDYIEVHAANNTAATNITVTSMNFIITEIK